MKTVMYLINLTGSPFHSASYIYACSHNMRRLPSICQTTSQSHTIKVYSHIYTVLVEAANEWEDKKDFISDDNSSLQKDSLLLTLIVVP